MNTDIKMQIITNKISIINNHIPDGQFTVNPRFTRNIGKANDGRFFTELSVAIISTPETPFPFDIQVSITGVFELPNIDSNNIDIFLKVNAIQILFPYLRTMVTSLTSTAMVPPIVLPIINPNTLFPESAN